MRGDGCGRWCLLLLAPPCANTSGLGTGDASLGRAMAVMAHPRTDARGSISAWMIHAVTSIACPLSRIRTDAEQLRATLLDRDHRLVRLRAGLVVVERWTAQLVAQVSEAIDGARASVDAAGAIHLD